MTTSGSKDSRWRLVVGLLTLVVLALVVDRLQAPAPKSEKATRPADQLDLVRLQLRLDALEDEVQTLRRARHTPESPTETRLAAAAQPTEAPEPIEAAEAQSAQPPAEEAAPPEDFAQIRAHAEAQTQALREGLDGRLHAEDIDEGWAAQQEARILADIGNGQLGSAYIVDSQCRSTLCRVQIEHPEAGGLDRVMFEMSSKPAFAGRRLYFEQDTSDGKTGRMTVYVARAGQALPTDRAQASHQP